MGDESDFLGRERYTEEEGWRETKQKQGQQEDGELARRASRRRSQ